MSKESGESAVNVSDVLYDVDASDPRSRLVDRVDLDPSVVKQISELMGELSRLREAERQLSLASQRYMKLGETDMRALHFLIVAENVDSIVTPGALAKHLEISTASVTKLLDRLETAGHVVRSAHPTDRRALAITITAATKEAAVSTVGRKHARRFIAAAKLTNEQRETVIHFLRDMTRELTGDSDAEPSESASQLRKQ